jgi:hypothetical protein
MWGGLCEATTLRCACSTTIWSSCWTRSFFSLCPSEWMRARIWVEGQACTRHPEIPSRRLSGGKGLAWPARTPGSEEFWVEVFWVWLEVQLQSRRAPGPWWRTTIRILILPITSLSKFEDLLTAGLLHHRELCGLFLAKLLNLQTGLPHRFVGSGPCLVHISLHLSSALHRHEIKLH